VLVNDMVIPLNDFTQLYIGNVLRGIATSLGCPGSSVSLDIDAGGLNLLSEGTSHPVSTEFARSMVESTVRGMLSPLEGVVWIERITISTRE
jgi:hypothetical protein